MLTESIRQQTDDQIIDATLTLLQSQSYDQLAVTEITAHGGVSRMAFYRHFGTKEAVIKTIVEQLTDDFAKEAAAYRWKAKSLHAILRIRAS